MMQNSIQNTVKYLRLINLKTALNTIKECTPITKSQPNSSIGVFSKVKVMSFSPHTINLEITNPQSGKRKQDPLSYIPIVNPRSILPLIDTWRKDEIGLPPIQQEEKQAVRLIVIRRKKMKNHQRRKLWKRMRYRWARIKKNRKIKKEKIFQNELLAMVKQANAFSAEEYVNGKLEKANHTPLPTRWRHKRLPEFIIRQLLGIDKKINYKHNDVYKA